MRRLMNVRPPRGTGRIFGLLPLAALLFAYVAVSTARLAANPNEKLFPSLAAMGDVVARYAFAVDPRTGDVLLWTDTLASLIRLISGLGIATITGLVLGIALGVIPVIRSGLGTLVAIIAVVPPMVENVGDAAADLSRVAEDRRVIAVGEDRAALLAVAARGERAVDHFRGGDQEALHARRERDAAGVV